MRLIKLAFALVVVSSVAAGAARADLPTTVKITIQDATLTSPLTVLVTGTATCPGGTVGVTVNQESFGFGGSGFGFAQVALDGRWAVGVSGGPYVKDKATVRAGVACNNPVGGFDEERTMLIHE
jgi:hypothetical protein